MYHSSFLFMAELEANDGKAIVASSSAYYRKKGKLAGFTRQFPFFEDHLR